jgi:hypothetical protein
MVQSFQHLCEVDAGLWGAGHLLHKLGQLLQFNDNAPLRCFTFISG